MNRVSVILWDHIKKTNVKFESRNGEECIWQIRYRWDLLTHKVRRWTFRFTILKCSNNVRNMSISSLISTFSWILASTVRRFSSWDRKWLSQPCVYSHPIFPSQERRATLSQSFPGLSQSFPEIQGMTLIGPRWSRCPLGPIPLVRGWRTLTDASWIRCLAVQNSCWTACKTMGMGRGNFSKNYKGTKWTKATDVHNAIL